MKSQFLDVCGVMKKNSPTTETNKQQQKGKQRGVKSSTTGKIYFIALWIYDL